ncbi:MAG: hypothetical protein AAFU56_02750 [Pseudomonadota bacterium]
MKLTSPLMIVALACVLAGCTSIAATKPGVDAGAGGPLGPSRALSFSANSEFDRGLNDQERRKLTEAEARALNFGKGGERIAWQSDRSGISGFITASQPFRVGQSDCRRFSHKLNRAGKAVSANGTACRRAGGDWKLVQ